MEFQTLLQKISPVLRRIASKLSRQAAYAGAPDDFYQEAVLHLWGRFNRGELEAATDSYMLQSCYFHLKNYTRLQRKHTRCVSLRQPFQDEAEELLEREYADTQPDCREQLHAAFLIETIRNNGFTPREKEVIALWMDALDTRTMGARLGISHVRVVKLMASIRQKCRQYRDYC